MAKKKGKSVSFDAMVKFFMHSYSIPTKRDIDGLVARLERIERLISNATMGHGRRKEENKTSGKQNVATASDTVLQIIRRHREGLNFAEIKLQSGFDEKKLRNILFRLNKLGKIKRKSRGIYEQTASGRNHNEP